MKNSTHTRLIDHLFKHEYGKMVALLVNTYGTENLPIIEDAIQDTYIKALKIWIHQPPQNPQAWLYTVTRNRIIDQFRRKSRQDADSTDFSKVHSNPVTPLMPGEIEDSQLKLIFLCSQLQLKDRDRIGITLQLVSGFGIKEIAKALQQNIESTKKRIQRAKKKLQDSEFQMASEVIFDPNFLPPILEILYLIFNEGYYTAYSDTLIKKDLCAEAMRLCQLVIKQCGDKTYEAKGLMSLMCYHASRLDSRVNSQMEYILLKDQNRNSWNRPLINLGHKYLAEACQVKTMSVYHLEALIAAQYVIPDSCDEINWSRLSHLYTLLYELKPTPQIYLNQVVICIQMGTLSSAIHSFKKLKSTDFLPNPYLYHMVGGELFRVCHMQSVAISHYHSALKLAESSIERKLIEEKLAKL